MANHSPLHIFGIRHHGPGSARSLCQSLEALQPDIILVEGPPDADGVLDAIAHPDLNPPVAILIYAPDQPQESVYYPFADFSPELQAIRYGLAQGIPVQFMDLPQTHQIAIRLATKSTEAESLEATESTEDTDVEVTSSPPSSSAEEDTSISTEGTPNSEDPSDVIEPEALATEPALIRADPLSWLAQSAGYEDGERWWDQMVEQRTSDMDVFTGILEAMQVLRTEVEQVYPINLENPKDLREARREAFMRKTIRQAKKAGHEKIAIVCGAWHAPVLQDPLLPAKADNALLKGLPKCKVKATWIPWTYERLAWRSGYGAGIESPGWYHHLWSTPEQTSIHWLTKVARLLRQQEMDASSASVIEAVRLAQTLATLRDRPMPGLADLNEAAQTVLCFGDDLPMKLIHEQLIISDRLGHVPADTPLVPLQADLKQRVKTLRLKFEATEKELQLDLRKPNDLARSQLLHRLSLLKIPWGKSTDSRSKGTFKEAWILQWQPEFELALIEAGQWGNTIEVASLTYAVHLANTATQLPPLTQLLDQVLLADLSHAIPRLMDCLQAQAVVTSDIVHLLTALPPLVNIIRYQDVRQTDMTGVAQVVDGLVMRSCIGLPGACASLDDDAAVAMNEHLTQTHRALKLLQNSEYLDVWRSLLCQLLDQHQLHGLLAGQSCRLLLDDGYLDAPEAARRLNLALSQGNEPIQSAHWIEGFLSGSGLLLLHDDSIWQVLDQWVTTLAPDYFISLLPLLRRTFSSFPAPERRQMGQRVTQGQMPVSGQDNQPLNQARAESVLPLVAQLLGVTL